MLTNCSQREFTRVWDEFNELHLPESMWATIENAFKEVDRCMSDQDLWCKEDSDDDN